MSDNYYCLSLFDHLFDFIDIDDDIWLIIVLVVIALLLIILVIAIINLNRSKKQRNTHQIVDIENDVINDEIVRIIASHEYLNKEPSNDNINK